MTEIETNIIYNESNLATLARLPDNSINCVVTSPPYYGMRNYGTEPQVWGGDPACDHQWSRLIRPPRGGKGSLTANVGSNKLDKMNGRDGETYSDECKLCNAWLGELGQEPNVLMFIDNLITIFHEIYRVLTPDGTCWVNLDDSYNSGGNVRSGPDQTKALHNTTVNRSKVGYVKNSTSNQPVRRKSMFNVPQRFAIAMTDQIGFIQRNACIWQKDSVSPESVKDRLTHEYEMFYLFVKEPKYFFVQQLEPYQGIAQKRSEKKLEHHDQLAVPYNRAGDGSPDGRNMRDVLRINTDPSNIEHYATYPKRLAELPIKAGCPEGGIVYDPFTGSGTTPLTAYRLNRRFIGSELQTAYFMIATGRLDIEMEKGRLFI